MATKSEGGEEMVDVSMLKLFGGLFYLILALCVFSGTWDLFRKYRRTNATAIKAHIAAYRIQKMVENRSR
jgi:hypothetical protein